METLKVNVKCRQPIPNIKARPLTGTCYDLDLTVAQIKMCLLKGAIVEAVLEDRTTKAITLKNLSEVISTKTEVKIKEPHKIVVKPEPVTSTQSKVGEIVAESVTKVEAVVEEQPVNAVEEVKEEVVAEPVTTAVEEVKEEVVAEPVTDTAEEAVEQKQTQQYQNKQKNKNK